MSPSDTSAMAHYDAETLGLIALGESDAASDGLRHLDTCATCAAEVSSLRNVVAAGRAGKDAPLAEPPADLWDRISAQLQHDSDNTSADTASEAANVVPLSSARRERSNRGRMMTWIGVAAAAVGLIAGVAITSLVTTKSDAPKTVASAPLEGEAVKAAHGTATLTYNKQQQPELLITVVNLPKSDHGFYEVWLMNATPVRFVALGVLGADHTGTFQLPPNLPANNYGYIDVSLQPFNGSPLHSGVSVVRGAIPAANPKA